MKKICFMSKTILCNFYLCFSSNRSLGTFINVHFFKNLNIHVVSYVRGNIYAESLSSIIILYYDKFNMWKTLCKGFFPLCEPQFERFFYVVGYLQFKIFFHVVGYLQFELFFHIVGYLQFEIFFHVVGYNLKDSLPCCGIYLWGKRKQKTQDLIFDKLIMKKNVSVECVLSYVEAFSLYKSENNSCILDWNWLWF